MSQTNAPKILFLSTESMTQPELTPQEAADEGAEIDWATECMLCCPHSKLMGVKAVRIVTGWGLKESKEAVESLPGLIYGLCSLGDLYRIAYPIRESLIGKFEVSGALIPEPINWQVEIQSVNVSSNIPRVIEIISDELPAWVTSLDRSSFRFPWRLERSYTQQDAERIAEAMTQVGAVCEIDELFDVVDEEDVCLEQQPRRYVHALGLRHRAVQIWVFNSDGELLVHQRSASKDEFPLLWNSSASGHVAAGESYKDAARRELLEELGLRAKLCFKQKWPASDETAQEFTQLYFCFTDDEPTLQAEEITAAAWYHPDVLADELDASPERFTPVFRMMFAWFRR